MDGERMNAALPIAVVDDDTDIRDLLRDVLSEEGYTPYLFDGTDDTYRGLRDVAPAALILDLHLAQPGAAWALLDHLSTDLTLARAVIVICSGDVTELAEHRRALEGRTYAVLPKPFDIDELGTLLQRLIQQAA
jgi:two-component system nitrogen regulation response regulator NtrX